MKSDTVTIEVPRSALTVVERPHSVSQITSERVLGIPRRAFLALARDFAEAGGEVTSIGKLRVVALEPLVDWMRRRATTPAKVTQPANDHDDVSELEASLGIVSITSRRTANK